MAVRSGLFLSDDGPESSFLSTKKPQNTLISCGLSLFRLLLAGTFSSLQLDCSNLSDPLSGAGGD